MGPDGFDGPYEFYHENGQLRERSTYVAGEVDGTAVSYHENGQVAERGTYNMFVRCGDWIIEGEARTYPPC